MSKYWEVCPQLQQSLFKKNRKGYVDLRIDKSDIKTAIYQHPEFAAFIVGMNAHFAEWRKRSAKSLKALTVDCHPRDVIGPLAEGLIQHYQDKPLIDPYTVYQHLMTYWSETMSDDCYIISEEATARSW